MRTYYVIFVLATADCLEATE
jgi:hypothetical protein